jgi:hypothetical protein
MSIEGPPDESEVSSDLRSPEAARKVIDFAVDDDVDELTKVTLVPADEEYEPW